MEQATEAIPESERIMMQRIQLQREMKCPEKAI